MLCFSGLLKVKATAKSKGELKEVASCCNVLGEIFQQQGKYEDAVSQHEVKGLIFITFILFETLFFRKKG